MGQVSYFVGQLSLSLFSNKKFMATRALKTQDKESHSSLFIRYEKNFRHLQNIVLTAKNGVSAKAFFDVAVVSGIEKNKLAGLLNVSLKSLNRYKQQNKKLSPEKVTNSRPMALAQKGENFRNLNEFRKWMDEPAYGLGNMIPKPRKLREA
jgi:hypothetical protein